MRPSLWKTQQSLCNTRPSLWGFMRKPKARPIVWKARPCVFVVRRLMLSQSATVYNRYICSTIYTYHTGCWGNSCHGDSWGRGKSDKSITVSYSYWNRCQIIHRRKTEWHYEFDNLEDQDIKVYLSLLKKIDHAEEFKIKMYILKEVCYMATSIPVIHFLYSTIVSLIQGSTWSDLYVKNVLFISNTCCSHPLVDWRKFEQYVDLRKAIVALLF